MTSDSKLPPKGKMKLRRGFIAAETGQAYAALAEAFAARGMACIRSDDIAPGPLTGELLRHLEAVDFMCASANDATGAHVLFELGAAYMLGKPIILFTTTYDRLFGGLRGIYVVKATIDDLPTVSAEIDRFLQHAKPLGPTNEAAEPRQRPNLSWAREELTALRRDEPADRGLRFERLLSEIFRRTGGEVVQEARFGSDQTADLIVWLDDVAAEVGGPIIVECKYSLQGSGDSLMNAVKQVEKYIDASSAAFGLVVYDHSRPVPRPPWPDTPRVLTFRIDELIQALENGSLAEQVVQRRRGASYARVAAGGPA
jgi:hypothetical protein